MGHTVRITRRLESETLHLPELRALVGKEVEIVISELERTPGDDRRYPLRGSILRYEDPFGPAAPKDWEAG